MLRDAAWQKFTDDSKGLVPTIIRIIFAMLVDVIEVCTS
jgi:hypothetical protein